VKIGVAGLGFWGSKHVRVLSSVPGVQEVSCYDPREDRRDAISSAFPAAEVVSSFEQLLDRVDAVVIATNPGSHEPLGLAALRRGRHLLVEKPLATSSSGARALVRAADEAGLVLMTGHTFVFNPAVERLQRDITAGHLGNVMRIHSERLNLGKHQADCDVVWDLAPHDISIIMMLTGQLPTSVRCIGRGHINPDVVDDAHLLLDLGSTGVQAVVHVSWLDPRKVRRVTVVGSRRMAVFDDLRDEERLRVYDKGVEQDFEERPHAVPHSYRYGDIVAPLLPAHEPLQREDEHFVECVRTGARPHTDGRAGAAVVRVLEAATESLRHDGERVDVS
jgi:predicted dehydrogenase